MPPTVFNQSELRLIQTESACDDWFQTELARMDRAAMISAAVASCVLI